MSELLLCCSVEDSVNVNACSRGKDLFTLAIQGNEVSVLATAGIMFFPAV